MRKNLIDGLAWFLVTIAAVTLFLFTLAGVALLAKLAVLALKTGWTAI